MTEEELGITTRNYVKGEIETVDTYRKVVDYNRIISQFARCKRGSMDARAISQFGNFIQEMRSYLTWGDLSNIEDISEFQESIDQDKWDSADFTSYLCLFAKYGGVEESVRKVAETPSFSKQNRQTEENQ